MPRAKPRRSTRKHRTSTRNKSMKKLEFPNYIEFSEWLSTTASPNELRNEKYDGLGGWSLIGIPLEETRELLDRTLREIVMKTIMPPTFTKAEYKRASERILKLGNLLGFDSDSEFALVHNQFETICLPYHLTTTQEYTRARNWLMTSSHLLSLATDAEVEAARVQVIRSRLPRPLSATVAAYHRVSNCV
ncbi:hypothetical protein BDF22DRAFT_747048 [Syncephalis plumigaleata]|nr:hypothetical protein BDF22DRAFT_747048 [Syncephalis plumigaleata]